MTETTKTVLIVGGIAVAGFVAYRYLMAKRGVGTGTTTGRPTSGGTSSPSGGGNWWDNLGAIGGAISGGINSIENSYNTITGQGGG